ncbi:hypothetical protein PACTADRAFT_18224 [Pachysolen tannophilus NRRL Y-2460]|uniref:Ada DNA repair metal-binding domain-containing protein n=1 Tax=Pachysolen tannophilus NRRL Y-2460 TaxID=669874 RepID=A0A1E4TP84_PACTA|nr:hypothetical protein PACTADRAFT_18224 [Pachysolen tannophilus NRRL Y-2460]
MSYISDIAKWNAYQFNDPFAADKFIVCNKSTKVCCRPNCDMGLQTNLKSEVLFVDDVEDALKMGFKKCDHCLISEVNGENNDKVITVDIDVLVETVCAINSKIGFIPPLSDDDMESNAIRENVLKKSKLRRNSAPAVHGGGGGGLGGGPGGLGAVGAGAADAEKSGISKNESDHVRLVDLACRHIALAAASTALKLNEEKVKSKQQLEQQEKADGAGNGSNKKRRRRGGVLGFKELASKSKLSPWHFHRVFKSVTGLTPKSYGDKCWEYIKKYYDQNGNFSTKKAICLSISIANPTSSPPEPTTFKEDVFYIGNRQVQPKTEPEDNSKHLSTAVPQHHHSSTSSQVSSSGEDNGNNLSTPPSSASVLSLNDGYLNSPMVPVSNYTTGTNVINFLESPQALGDNFTYNKNGNSNSSNNFQFNDVSNNGMLLNNAGNNPQATAREQFIVDSLLNSNANTVGPQNGNYSTNGLSTTPSSGFLPADLLNANTLAAQNQPSLREDSGFPFTFQKNHRRAVSDADANYFKYDLNDLENWDFFQPSAYFNLNDNAMGQTCDDIKDSKNTMNLPISDDASIFNPNFSIASTNTNDNNNTNTNNSSNSNNNNSNNNINNSSGLQFDQKFFGDNDAFSLDTTRADLNFSSSSDNFLDLPIGGNNCGGNNIEFQAFEPATFQALQMI